MDSTSEKTRVTVKFVKGDILKSRAQTIVNTVNCKGIMGKGLALQFKKRYPKMYEEYKEACRQGNLKIGTLLPPYKVSDRRWILNFPTKADWRQKSKSEYIVAGLACFKEKYKEWGITSIAFPRLGCQLGGLSWRKVKPVMMRYLEDLPELEISIYTYKPEPTKSKKLKKRTANKRKRMSKTPDSQRSLASFS